MGCSTDLSDCTLHSPMTSLQIPDIQAALESLDDGDEFASDPILHHLLRKGSAIPQASTRARLHRPSHPRPQTRRLPGNIDLAVLRRENQTTTHVTPRIDSYASGLFREQLCVVGPPPVRLRALSPVQEREVRRRLFDLLQRALNRRQPNIVMPREKRLNSGSVYLMEVEIDNTVVGVSLHILLNDTCLICISAG
jgi:hypothetical protein